MDGSGGFWDWSEELRFLQNAEAARHIILEKSSGSAQNVASDSVQIDHCEEKDCVLIDLTSDHSCLRSKDSHLANESVGPLAPVLFKQSEAFHPVDDSSIDEAHGLSSDTVSIAVPDSSYSDLATDGQREPAHDEATFGDLGQYIGCGGAEQEEDFSCPSEPSPCPSEPSSTGSSEPNERVHNHPQLTTDRQEDGVCWDDGVSGDYGVCADASVCGGSADQESEAQSQNLSALDDIRVRLAFDCLEGDGGKNDVSEDDARTLRPVADCLESANAARGKIFVLPFPLSLPLSIPLLPLRAVGLLAHPLRHVPKIALILLSSAPASRPQQVESRADPSTPPKVNRRKRRSSRGTKSRHFTRKHSLLDLTDPHWLRDDRAPSPGSSMAECAQQMSSENSSSSLDAQEQSEQLYEAGGSEEPRTGGALGGDPVTSAHGLLVSADTSADASNSPHRKTERSRPPQLEISEVTPLTSVHSQRWESDSFALQYSPSSLSLDGGFGYRGVDGGADVSPMSSRSSSSSSLGEPEMQSETGSSTDESDSHLYLPSNHLLLTPPPDLAVVEPPLKPLSELSRRFVLPPGVTDPAQMEELEQQWANQLRSRRAEHKDQHYMSAAELMSPPWSNLVFWHGSDKKGQPVLYCKLGLAVRTLPRHMQDRMGCALYSMVELAENSLWRPECGWGFQRMTVVVDAEGLGITRMAPVEALKHGFKLIHRDYPARQGHTYIINVPPLLSMMIGVFKRVIGYDEKEANERLGVYGRNYRAHLQKDFEPGMLHADFGGSCPCCAADKDKEVGPSPPDASLAVKRQGRPEDWVLDFVPSHQL